MDARQVQSMDKVAPGRTVTRVSHVAPSGSATRRFRARRSPSQAWAWQNAEEHKLPSDLKMDFRKARLLPAAYHIFMRCGERSS